MKTFALLTGLFLFTMIAQSLDAQQSQQPPTETIKTAANPTPEQKEVIDLSKTKWDWMADKKVDLLETLFDDNAMFTHMGGTWGKARELSTIKSGGIWYKKAVVYAVDARIFGNAAIVLEDIDLQAAVGEHEVTNPQRSFSPIINTFRVLMTGIGFPANSSRNSSATEKCFGIGDTSIGLRSTIIFRLMAGLLRMGDALATAACRSNGATAPIFTIANALCGTTANTTLKARNTPTVTMASSRCVLTAQSLERTISTWR
jgi:hypothetical protein